MGVTYLDWDDNRIGVWSEVDMTWDEVKIVEELREIGGGSYSPYDFYVNVNKQSNVKKKKIVKLIAKINGQEYKEEKSTTADIKISIKDIKMLTEKLNITINV